MLGLSVARGGWGEEEGTREYWKRQPWDKLETQGSGTSQVSMRLTLAMTPSYGECGAGTSHLL